ncbi:MAG: glycoside hydrolase family 2, partial [Akkermansiaceae bacterium]|nr:glycoside hydrolase family 2 [Verrucomicrobiales bacterium]
EAGWPGWVFYASFQMNPRNSVWRDVPALNAYAARCQAVLQAGKPDNDVLVYWPIHDRWSNPQGMAQPFTVHNDVRDWFVNQSIGKAAEWLWNRGYQFDYVSDKQLAGAQVAKGMVQMPGGNYRVIVVPQCERMPEQTLSNLVALAEAGATVIFENQLPKDVPGLARLEARRAGFKLLTARPHALALSKRAGDGTVVVADLETALTATKTPREKLFDQPGLMCIRRSVNDGRFYFIANRGTKAFEGWLPIASAAQSAAMMNPSSGLTGVARSRVTGKEAAEVYVQLAPGDSTILKVFANRRARGENWNYWAATDATVPLTGTWQVKFLQGGPQLPSPFATDQLASWTKRSDTNAQRFAGTAQYSLTFAAPAGRAKTFWLDLGNVCQSARVRLNGEYLGTLLTPPFRIAVQKLKSRNNVLEVEVTNVSANRIRDLDRQGVNWRNFRDINFVNINYRPFDASNWPLTDSGLLGPVTLTPVASVVK